MSWASRPCQRPAHGRDARDALAALLLVAVLAGCGGIPRAQRVVTNPDPAAKIPAIKASVQTNDTSVVRQLIKDLESDDPAVRFYAIQGLERLTGQTFGYQYYADEQNRAAAVQRWKAWLAGWEAGRREASHR
ncbi:hypothetical protein [Fontivita pretiosa]|uniref:hypothetical protein n=1 Tax=Fontivita pretiosa TaxID=2989684 RepID=UPI003D163C16